MLWKCSLGQGFAIFVTVLSHNMAMKFLQIFEDLVDVFADTAQTQARRFEGVTVVLGSYVTFVSPWNAKSIPRATMERARVLQDASAQFLEPGRLSAVLMPIDK